MIAVREMTITCKAIVAICLLLRLPFLAGTEAVVGEAEVADDLPVVAVEGVGGLVEEVVEDPLGRQVQGVAVKTLTIEEEDLPLHQVEETAATENVREKETTRAGDSLTWGK